MRGCVSGLIVMLLAVTGIQAQETPVKSPIRFNFETGDLQGWKVVSGKFGPLPAHNDNDRHGGNFSKEGKYFIGTCELGQGPYSDAARLSSDAARLSSGAWRAGSGVTSVGGLPWG